MAIAVGVHTSTNSAGTTSLTTGSVTSSTSGSTFIIAGCSDVAPLTVTDSKTNLYTIIGTPQATSSGGLAWMYRSENGSGGASHTANATWALSDTPALFFLEITGAAAASFDKTAQAQDNASPFTVTSPTLSQAAELIAVVLHGNGSTNPATIAESTGFTLQEQQLNNASYDAGCLATKIVASTTAVTPSFTMSGSSSGALVLGTFKELTSSVVKGGVFGSPIVTGESRANA